MDCTLAALIACFSWSGLYIDSGLSYQNVGYYREWQWRESIYALEGVAYAPLATHDAGKVMRVVDNPYGRVALGYEVSFSALTWRIEASHVSSVIGNDHGINAVSVSARWYPFRR